MFSNPVMFLRNDFSGHWVREATACERSLNVVPVKVPPGQTWFNQPVDAVWIKSIKDRIQRNCLLNLQGQLSVKMQTNDSDVPFEGSGPR